MSNSPKWIVKVAERVAMGAIVGGIVTAIAGALCVGAAGATVGYVLDLRSTPATWNDGFMAPGAWLGMFLGAWSGVPGALIYGVNAFQCGPGRHAKALRSLLARVTLGQIAGTLGALSFYFAFALVVAQTHHQSFVGTVEDNADIIIWGAPALMMCGAIVGALMRPTQRVNREVVAR